MNKSLQHALLLILGLGLLLGGLIVPYSASELGWLLLATIPGAVLVLATVWIFVRETRRRGTPNHVKVDVFSWWMSFAVILVLSLFLLVANLAEDGLLEIGGLGVVMVVARALCKVSLSWWITLVTATLLACLSSDNFALMCGLLSGWILLSRLVPRVVEMRMARG